MEWARANVRSARSRSTSGAFVGSSRSLRVVSDRRDGRDCRQRTCAVRAGGRRGRSEEHTSELQSLMRISYAVFCLKKKKYNYSSDRRLKRNKKILSQ